MDSFGSCEGIVYSRKALSIDCVCMAGRFLVLFCSFDGVLGGGWLGMTVSERGVLVFFSTSSTHTQVGTVSDIVL